MLGFSAKEVGESLETSVASVNSALQRARGAGAPKVEEFLRVGPLSGEWRWRHLPARANAQPAIGVYSWDDEQQAHLPFALDVLTLEGDRIKEVTAFIVRTTELPEESFRRWPDQQADSERVRSVFERFGLPTRLA